MPYPGLQICDIGVTASSGTYKRNVMRQVTEFLKSGILRLQFKVNAVSYIFTRIIWSFKKYTREIMFSHIE
jgi:hypothetical protein